MSFDWQRTACPLGQTKGDFCIPWTDQKVYLGATCSALQ